MQKCLQLFHLLDLSVSHTLIYLWRPASNATNTHRPLPSAPASHTLERDFSTIFSNFQTLLVAFFHKRYILTNLATFFGKKRSFHSVGRCLQYCPASARSDFPGAASPLSASVLCSERQRSSAFSWPHRSRLVSKWVQNSVSKHLSLTDCLYF